MAARDDGAPGRDSRSQATASTAAATAGALVVDVANVVGSRPDGWWRDRAGAAARLLAGLSRLAAAQPSLGPVVAVVEGAARTVADVPGVELVRAPGSGDDAVVAEAGRRPGATVVTADRGLRARLSPDTGVLGPTGLWRLVDNVAG